MKTERMFGDVVAPSVHVGNGKKRYLLPLSVALHVVIVAVVVIAPLLGDIGLPNVVQAMGDYIRVVDIALPPPPPPPGKKPEAAAPKDPTDPRLPPADPPNGYDNKDRPFEPPPACVGCVDTPPGDDPVPPGTYDPTPPPPPAPPPPPEKPVIVGGQIQQPKKVFDARPVYPPTAQAARVQGMVIIQCELDVSGNVRDARILRSIPLLDAAALEAVRQWKFTPTLLNGRAVPVLMTVTVNFTLQ